MAKKKTQNNPQATDQASSEKEKKKDIELFKSSRMRSKEVAMKYFDDLINRVRESSGGLFIPPAFVRAFGKDIKVASVLVYLLHTEQKLTQNKGDEFVTYYKDISSVTGLNRIPVIRIINNLRTDEVIKTERKGIPAMPHYRINYNMIIALLMESHFDDVYVEDYFSDGNSETNRNSESKTTSDNSNA
jgi:hypothetical protein